MSEGKIKIKLKNMFFSRVGTLSVMSEDSLTIEYNERALIAKVFHQQESFHGFL